MLTGLNLAEMFWLACAGFALDAVFDEPRHAHPLVAFGRIAERIESRLNRAAVDGVVQRRLPNGETDWRRLEQALILWKEMQWA